MDRDSPTDWQLVRFVEHLDRWAELELPDQDTRLLVAAWIVGRSDQPYAGVRREPGFATYGSGGYPERLTVTVRS